MQLNKVFKGMVIALPVVTLMACSSSSQVEEQAASNQTQASQETEQGSNVQTQPMEPVKSAEEVKREKLEALQNDQVVHFEFDRSTIQPEYYDVLSKHAEFLVENPNENVTIEGHCDQRGTPEYNIALGERRAKSISTYLQNAGVSASQISIVSYGEEKPVNTAQTEAAFAENRRGVLVY